AVRAGVKQRGPLEVLGRLGGGVREGVPRNVPGAEGGVGRAVGRVAQAVPVATDHARRGRFTRGGAATGRQPAAVTVPFHPPWTAAPPREFPEAEPRPQLAALSALSGRETIVRKMPFFPGLPRPRWRGPCCRR